MKEICWISITYPTVGRKMCRRCHWVPSRNRFYLAWFLTKLHHFGLKMFRINSTFQPCSRKNHTTLHSAAIGSNRARFAVEGKNKAFQISKWPVRVLDASPFTQISTDFLHSAAKMMLINCSFRIKSHKHLFLPLTCLPWPVNKTPLHFRIGCTQRSPSTNNIPQTSANMTSTTWPHPAITLLPHTFPALSYIQN